MKEEYIMISLVLLFFLIIFIFAMIVTYIDENRLLKTAFNRERLIKVFKKHREFDIPIELIKTKKNTYKNVYWFYIELSVVEDYFKIGEEIINYCDVIEIKESENISLN